jgi:hypothetical protein
MRLYVIGAAAVMAIMCSTVVNAQSLKQKEYVAKQDAAAADLMPHLKQECGTDIPVKFDWSNTPKPEDFKYDASDFCGSAVWAVKQICSSSPTGKDTVQQKIKKVTCGFGKESIAIKDGGLDFKIDFDGADHAYHALEWLKNNL